MSRPPIITFGRAIAAVRRHRGWRKPDVAARITIQNGQPMSTQYLQDIESGKTNCRADAMIKQFSSVLGINLDYLYYLANRFPPDIRTPALSAKQFKAAIQAFRSPDHAPRHKNNFESPSPGSD